MAWCIARLARELLEANAQRLLGLLVEARVVLELEHQARAVGVEADLLELDVRLRDELPEALEVRRLDVGVLALRDVRLPIEHVRDDAQHVGDRRRGVPVEPLLEVDVDAASRQVP
jgi:hypothetical protein